MQTSSLVVKLELCSQSAAALEALIAGYGFDPVLRMQLRFWGLFSRLTNGAKA
jgi:hypothetical protein